MPTIVLQYGFGEKTGKQKPAQSTASVAASPGLWHYATVNGKLRSFERVGTDSSGNEIYRDQNRRK